MSAIYDYYNEAALILADDSSSEAYFKAYAVLEDATNPVTNRHIQNLYQQIVNKNHIDFDDIPVSKGNIILYKGYGPMMECLQTIQSLTDAQRIKDTEKVIATIQTAIENITRLSDLYEKGFAKKNDYVMLEYNLFVYSCVQATSSVLSECVEFIKGFSDDTMQLQLRNTKYRASAFYITQLNKFNKIVATTNYRTYLQTVLNGERENFIGATAVGVIAVASAVLIAIVPVSRSLVYQFYKLRAKLSDALALQAYFLELNKSCVEANRTFDAEKKKRVIAKQEKLRQAFTKMASRLQVDNATATSQAQRDLTKDNQNLSLSGTTDDVNNSDYSGLL